MPTIKCSFSGCESNIITENKLSFFRYPINDRKRCEQWVKNSANHKIREIFGHNLRQLRYRTVCEKHFYAYEIISHKNRKQLISSSVPKYAMPGHMGGPTPVPPTATIAQISTTASTPSSLAIDNANTFNQSLANISSVNRRLSSGADVSDEYEDIDDDDMDSHSSTSEDNFIDNSLRNLEQIERTINSILNKQSLEMSAAVNGSGGDHRTDAQPSDTRCSDQSFSDNNAECQDEDLVEKLLNFEQILTENDDNFASNLNSIQSLISQSFGSTYGHPLGGYHSKQKRKCLTISEKLEIIRDFNDGMKRTDIMRKYCLPYQSSLSAILRNKDKYIEYITKGFGREDKLKRVKSRRGWVVPKATPLPAKVPKAAAQRLAHMMANIAGADRAHFSGHKFTHRSFAGAGSDGYKRSVRVKKDRLASSRPVGRPKGSTAKTASALSLAKNRLNIEHKVRRNGTKRCSAQNSGRKSTKNGQNVNNCGDPSAADRTVSQCTVGISEPIAEPVGMDRDFGALPVHNVNNNVLNSVNNSVVNSVNNHNMYNKPNSEHSVQSTSYGDGKQILDIMAKHQMKQSLDKQKRRPITLEEKVLIIQDVEAGMKRSVVLQKYSLPHKSNLTGILKNRDKYLSNAMNGKSGKLKRVRGFGGPKLTAGQHNTHHQSDDDLHHSDGVDVVDGAVSGGHHPLSAQHIPPFEALVGAASYVATAAGRDHHLPPFEANMNLLNNNAFSKLFNDSSFNERLLFGSSGSGGSGDEEFQCPSEILDLTLTVGSDKQKRRSISIEDKIEIIKDIDAGMKRLDVLQKYSLADYSNLNTILKNRDKYMANESNVKRKRMREGKYGDVEEELTRRVDQCLMAGISITGSLLQDIAKEVAKSLNVLDFKASNGWLNRYKKRRLLWLSANSAAAVAAAATQCFQ